MQPTRGDREMILDENIITLRQVIERVGEQNLDLPVYIETQYSNGTKPAHDAYLLYTDDKPVGIEVGSRE